MAVEVLRQADELRADRRAGVRARARCGHTQASRRSDALIGIEGRGPSGFTELAGLSTYSIVEAHELFSAVDDVRVTSVVVPYDVRITRSRLASRWFQALVSSQLGWFPAVEASKPRRQPIGAGR